MPLNNNIHLEWDRLKKKYIHCRRSPRENEKIYKKETQQFGTKKLQK
jgi:hypothetical protein